MSKPKRSHREAFLHIACTHDQKERIKKNAKQDGAKSITEYILTLALKGDTEEFGFMRRKADGALVTADVYYLLTEIAQQLKTKPTPNEELTQEAIRVVREVGKDITMHRLKQEIERSL